MIHIPLIIHSPVGLSAGKAFSHDIIQMIIHAGLMVKFVLLVLFLFSVVSWTIIFFKFRLLSKARRETESFLELFWENKGLKKLYMACKGLDYSPVARLFRAGYAEFSRMKKIQGSSDPQELQEAMGSHEYRRSKQTVMDNLERSLKKATIDQNNRLERAISFLATTGNTAPFIGLFGTVWGIMEAFQGIGLKGSANLAVVAPGISEALIATAAGLAAAIPAVVAFNFFSRRVVALRAEMDIFTSEFLSMVERQFFKEQMVIKAGG